jgi:hypothetical protein
MFGVLHSMDCLFDAEVFMRFLHHRSLRNFNSASHVLKDTIWLFRVGYGVPKKYLFSFPGFRSSQFANTPLV